MTQAASSFSSAPAVNEEIIFQQVLGTRREHKIGVGRTLSQRVHDNTSSSSSCSEKSSVRVDPHVEEYLRRLYEQNLQMYESHRMMQQLLAQLHPNIQFSIITCPEPYISLGHPTPPGPLPLPDAGDDDASDTANLGDLFFIFLFYNFVIKLHLILLMK